MTSSIWAFFIFIEFLSSVYIYQNYYTDEYLSRVEIGEQIFANIRSRWPENYSFEQGFWDK